ncbi:MAG: type IV pilin N-terminal domain-containing protein [Methanocorpusculum sp.]|nr:type IV pilin N-terminal domain-containing protein [Methanocorpusculum sp.]MBQ4597243.1 type IV pilin N-terminal domain-containing protein [Methanocorpusculum sp.]
MKQQERKDDAVSPVIGVMLMIVVTVVIAAVITMFATGMAGESTATTPVALVEADVSQHKGGYLQYFNLVHKGGDEMKLDNLQVIIEPIGGATSSGIILERTVNKIPLTKNQFYKDECEGKELEVIGFGVPYEKIESSGNGFGLSVPGKTGDDIVVSTGDRIKVPIKFSSEGVTFKVNGFTYASISKYQAGGNLNDGGMDSDIESGVLVKWTLSDTRTNGVIAKGEFIVP